MRKVLCERVSVCERYRVKFVEILNDIRIKLRQKWKIKWRRYEEFLNIFELDCFFLTVESLTRFLLIIRC